MSVEPQAYIKREERLNCIFAKAKITECLLKYKRKYGIFSRKPSILEKYVEFMQNRHSFIVKTAMAARFSRQ